MATVVEKNAAKDIQWDTNKTKGRFPWDEWTNGEVYQAVEGDDFHSNDASFRMQLRKKAAELAKTVNVKTTKDEKTGVVSVFFQYV